MRSGQKKINQGLKSKRSIVTKIISLLMSILLMFASSYVVRGNDFFNTVFTKATTQKYLVSVITMKNNSATKLSDLDGKKFGVSYQHDTTTITKAIADMENESLGSKKIWLNMMTIADWPMLCIKVK